MKRVAIIGAGPAGLMVLHRFVQSGKCVSIEIFESSNSVGLGMPYSDAGASHEHVTNVSADELPELSYMLDEWVLSQSDEKLKEFSIDRATFHEKKGCS